MRSAGRRAGTATAARRPAGGAAPARRRGRTSSDLTATARKVRAALQDTVRIERLARTFRALGDAGRSKLILALSMGEFCVGDLAAALGASPSATSHQLRILRDLEIVRVRRDGKTQVYALNERAFGFCAPRFCQAWKQTLEGETLVRPGPPPRSRRSGA